MQDTGQAQNAIRHIAALPEEPLEIEIIRDEDYRNSAVYCSWQEIIAGGTVANPDTPLNRPRVVYAAR
tara:strand:- start:25323 stop:25526 length:204 start_codon:yes stop_codon:yes gene_type:complete